MVLVLKWPFFLLFFFGSIGQENVFYDILKPKNTFVGYKNKKFKQSKNWHFSKGVTHAFGPKMANFQYYFLGNIGQENVFYDILEPKNTFLGYKNTKFKTPKNGHFSEGVNQWRWSKNGDFSKKIFLSIIGQENVFYDILEPKNTFLGYKNEKFKKSKNWHFFKGLIFPKMGIFSSFFLRQ